MKLMWQIGAIQALSRQAYFTAIEGTVRYVSALLCLSLVMEFKVCLIKNAGVDSTTGGVGVVPPEASAPKRSRFPDLRGTTLTHLTVFLYYS